MIDISKITITSEMLTLIAEIDEFKGSWQFLSRLAPERLHALRKVATIESIGSSTRIEGSKLSDREVEKLLSNLQTYSFTSRDEQEVAGYSYACEEIFQRFEAIGFSENVFKQLHSWLLQFSNKDERHRGEYKKFPNHVEAFDEEGKSLGIVFETSSPFETQRKMQELTFWFKENLDEKTTHPLLLIGIFSVVFLAIHPFQDGNGRLSRVLTTLLLLKSGYSYVPYSSLESIIEKNKESYYLALRKTQGTLQANEPDFTAWITFFLRSLQKQKMHLERKISVEKTLTFHLSEIESRILTLLRDHGRLGISELETLTKINRNSVKKYLSDLVKKENIARHGKGRATWYTLP